MKHLFAPYEIALQLKEKGFDEECFGIWIERGTIFDVLYVARQEDAWMANQNDGILAPLYQQVIDWLEDEKNILIDIVHDYKFDEKSINTWHIIMMTKYGHQHIARYDFTFETRKETIEQAVKEALKLVK